RVIRLRVRPRGLLMAKKKAVPGKAAAAKKATPKEPTAGRRKPVRDEEALPVPMIPEEELAAHFPAVEAAARNGHLNVCVERLDARAVTDADAALRPGPFPRPPFACGDVRPLKRRPRGGG